MNTAFERRHELSDFLRTRRAKIVPSDVGLADGARRRTPGLRREEVALLANIGTTWYTRLEQGLPINVSTDVLAAISRALRLTSDERRHLYLLAGLPLTFAPREEEQVSDLVLRVLERPRAVAGLRSRAPLGRHSRGIAAPTPSPTSRVRAGLGAQYRLAPLPRRKLAVPLRRFAVRDAPLRRKLPDGRCEVSKRSRLHRTHRRPAHKLARVQTTLGRARRPGLRPKV